MVICKQLIGRVNTAALGRIDIPEDLVRTDSDKVDAIVYTVLSTKIYRLAIETILIYANALSLHLQMK